MSAISVNTLLDEAKCYSCYVPGDVIFLSKLALLDRISKRIFFKTILTFQSSADATSYSTPSFQPGANVLLLAVVTSSRIPAGASGTVAGNGLTWVVAAAGDTFNGSRTSIFRSVGSSPTNTALTASWGANVQTSCQIKVIEVPNAKITGANGADGIAQFNSEGTHGGNQISVIWGIAPNINNSILTSAVATGVTEIGVDINSPTAGPGWILYTQDSWLNPTICNVLLHSTGNTEINAFLDMVATTANECSVEIAHV